MISGCLEKTETSHFADDTFIMYSSKSLGTIESVVNCELKFVSKWLKLNRLSLNTGKTELIFFRSPQHSLNNDDISINFNGKKLVPVDYVKYLGMYIDKHLSWNFHIMQLAKKLSRANGIISKLRYYAPLEVCLQVYYAIFYSHLTYGCNIWGLTSEENLHKIEVLQKKCLRIITFSDFRCHANPLFLDLKVLKVRGIIQMQQMLLLYGFLQNSLPTDLNKLFRLNENVHSHVTRQTFHIPRIGSLTYGKNSIRFRGPELWNAMFKVGIIIDKTVKNNVTMNQIHSTFQFKGVLKKHFFYSYSLEL